MIALAGNGVSGSMSLLALWPPSPLIFLTLDTDNTDRKLLVKIKLRYLGPLGVGLLLRSVCYLAMVLREGGSTLSWRLAKSVGLPIDSMRLGFIFLIFERMLWESCIATAKVFSLRSVMPRYPYACFLQMMNDPRLLLSPTYLPIGNSKHSLSTSGNSSQSAEVLSLGTNTLGDPPHAEYIISQNNFCSERSAPSLAQRITISASQAAVLNVC